MSDKKEVYEDYLRGEASEPEVREVFGADFEEFEERRELVEIMEDTPNKEPSEDLFDTPAIDEFLEENQTADEL